MPGLLRWDAFNQLERLEDETDQFGTSSKAFWKTTQEPRATATERFEPPPPGTFCTTVSWRARDVPNV
jgi:hypothetical protein